MSQSALVTLTLAVKRSFRIISVVTGDGETITALTDDGIDELSQILSDARRSPEAWIDFLHCFVDDEELIARVKAKSPQ
ncbi:hypothetical protein LJR255_004059 [Pararhizobium sp. LjRoot255]|uniref:hypothetical protein n=1 Tax=Pararhizobium sp. LjRoot255 TaxID=3342298 RepID=UPI003ECC937A